MPRHLMEHPEDLSIVHLPGGQQPEFDWTAGPFASLTRTPDETSVVCLSAAVPPGLRTEGPFRVVEVAGPLSFGAVGVLDVQRHSAGALRVHADQLAVHGRRLDEPRPIARGRGRGAGSLMLTANEACAPGVLT